MKNITESPAKSLVTNRLVIASECVAIYLQESGMPKSREREREGEHVLI